MNFTEFAEFRCKASVKKQKNKVISGTSKSSPLTSIKPLHQCMTFLCLEISLPMQRSHDTLGFFISAKIWCLETALPLLFLCIVLLTMEGLATWSHRES